MAKKNKHGQQPRPQQPKPVVEKVEAEVEVKEETKETQLFEWVGETAISTQDPFLSVYEQDRYFGVRKITTKRSNSALLYERFGYKWGYNCKQANCQLLLDKDSGKKAGIIPCIPLRFVWKKANDFTHGQAEKTYGVSLEEWSAAQKALEAYFVRKRDERGDKKVNRPWLIQDVLGIPELEFEQLFFEKGDKIVRLIQGAIQGDIAQSEYLLKKWNKIRIYLHKVALDKAHGGIFSDGDTAILRAHGLEYLNDVKKYNIYQLKNMLIDHDFNDLHKQINAAYKEDLARRKDVRYKIYPFAFGLPLLLTMTIIGYIFKYTLLKNAPMTTVLLVVLSCWAVALGAILWAIYRGRLRRKKRPDYRYLTRRVKTVLISFSVFSLFAVGSLCVFYERYDGYDDILYYRNLSDGTITIAGMVNEDIEDVYIPESIDGKTVTEIDARAFKGEHIEYLSMPSTITTVEKKAFYNCEELEMVKLSDNLQAISKKQFANCYNLQTVVVPESVKTIEDKAFNDCHSITYMQLPTTLEHIGESAFEGCVEMDGVFELTSLKTLGERAFANCSTMRNVVFGAEQESIAEEAFYNCQTLQTVSGLDNIQTVEARAFYCCSNLGDVAFGDNLQEVGEEAFSQCSSMTNLLVPNSLQKMGENAFLGCMGLKTVSVPFIGEERGEKASLSYAIDCSGLGRNMLVTLTDTQVIYQSSFENCPAVTGIVFHDSVTEIEEGAFMGATGLRELKLPDNITEIKAETFKDCTCLRWVHGGASVQTIGESAFENCTWLEEVSFPALENIGANAFASCNEMQSLGDISSLKTIGAGAFASCYQLKSIHLPAGVVEIGEEAFSNSAFHTITVSSTLASIGANAFVDCDNVQTLDFSHTALSSIGANAFAEMDGLRNVSLPATAKDIPNGAFENDMLLETVILGGDLNSIGAGAFRGSSIINLVNFTGVKFIDEEAFAYCENLGYDKNLNGGTFVVPMDLEKMGKNVFVGDKVETITIPFLGEERDSEDAGFTYTFGKNSPVKNITLTGMTTISKKLFNGADNVQSVQLNEGVVKIEKEAFKGLTLLENINFPTTLEYIGDSAFRGCESLREINLKDSSVKELGKNVFRACSSLRSLTLPSTLTEVPQGTAMDCFNLHSFDIEEGVKEIGADAFRNSGLNVLPDLKSIEVIGKNAFRGCSSLSSIVVPDVVQKIGKNAFADCFNLTKAKVPFLGSKRGKDFMGFKHVFGSSSSIYDLTVTDIERVAWTTFNRADNVEYLTLGEGVTRIAYRAFANMENLREVQIPASLQSIGRAAFRGCTQLNGLGLKHTAVTEVGTNAFRDCENLTYLYLPTNLQAVPKGMARGCYNLEDLEIGEATVKIEKQAFRNTGFSSVPDLKNVEELASMVFYDCANLRSLTLPDTLQKMGADAFGNCDNLRSVNVPFIGKSRDNNKKGFKYTFGNSSSIVRVTLTGIERIDSGTFEGADGLKEIYLQGGVVSIGTKAFKGAKQLSVLTLPSTLESIGAEAFENCYGLEEISLKDTKVTTIGKEAFRNCQNLYALTLPSTLTEIPDGLARDCAMLEYIEIPESVTKIGDSAFRDCEQLQYDYDTLVIPDAVETIGDSAFKNCYGISEIIFGHGLKTIGANAFDGCRYLFSIMTNEGLQEVGASAFRNCTYLESAYIAKTVEKMGRNIFRNCYDLREISVPFIGKNVKSASRLTYLTNNKELKELEVTAAKKIAKKAAKGFTSLREVHFNMGLEVIGKDAFTDCYSLLEIDIPDPKTSYVDAFIIPPYYYDDSSSSYLD